MRSNQIHHHAYNRAAGGGAYSVSPPQRSSRNLEINSSEAHTSNRSASRTLHAPIRSRMLASYERIQEDV